MRVLPLGDGGVLSGSIERLKCDRMKHRQRGNHAKKITSSNSFDELPSLSSPAQHEKIRERRVSIAYRNGEYERSSEAESDQDEQGFDNSQHWYVLDPQSHFCRRWDTLIPILLFFTATCTPFELGFVEPATSATDTLFVINRLVDAGFIIDVVINLCKGYKDDGPCVIVFNHALIMRRYFRTWFAVDVVSVLPFDTLALLLSSNANIRTVSRSLRLLKLLKLLRLLRMDRMIDRLKSEFGLSYLQLSMTKYFFVVVFTVHWTACAWGMVGAMTISAGPGESWIIDNGFIDSNVASRYSVAVEFALMSLSLGYGSVYPSSAAERMMAVCCMLFGGGIYACVIAGICEALTNSNPGHNLFKKTMDTTNTYFKTINLPEEERPKYREYLAKSYDRLQERLYKNVLDFLSPELQGALAIHCHSKWICQVPFFMCNDDAENARFVVALAQELKGMAFTRNEALTYQGDKAEKMYIVKQGLVCFGGRIRARGQFLGHDMILTHGISYYTARALTFVDCMVLERDSFLSILKLRNCVKISKKINITRIRLALLRWFQFVGSLMVKRFRHYRKPLSTQELKACRLQMRANANKTKNTLKKIPKGCGASMAFSGSNQNGHVLDMKDLEDKFEQFTAHLPDGVSLFPKEIKSPAEIVSEKCLEVEEKIQYAQLCAEALMKKLGVKPPPKPSENKIGARYIGWSKKDQTISNTTMTMPRHARRGRSGLAPPHHPGMFEEKTLRVPEKTLSLPVSGSGVDMFHM